MSDFWFGWIVGVLFVILVDAFATLVVAWWAYRSARRGRWGK